MSTQTPPRWDLTNVYPSLASKEYAADVQKLVALIDEQSAFVNSQLQMLNAQSPLPELAKACGELIERANQILLIGGTLRAYIESFVSTNSYDKEALAKQSEFDQIAVKIDKLEVLIRGWLGKLAEVLPDFINLDPRTQSHPYYLQETIKASR